MMDAIVNRTGIALVAIVAAVALFIASCGNGGQEQGLTRAEVEEIVRAEIAIALAPTPGAENGTTSQGADKSVGQATAESIQPDPGILDMGMVRNEVKKMIGIALADVPGPNPVKSEVREIAGNAIDFIPEANSGIITAATERVVREVAALMPLKSTPADYTKFFVENAIARYQAQGLDATLSHYNRAESVDDQWYVFIIDQDGTVVAHPDANRLGLDLNGWVGTDVNGYKFGPAMLSATEDGKWVSYMYRNPEKGGIGPDHTGALEYKHVWVVRHDGMLFAAGWHVPANEYTKFVVQEAISRYDDIGLEDTLAHYNSSSSVDGQWYVFVANSGGEIVAHHDQEWLGRSVDDLLVVDGISASGDGDWITGVDVNPATGNMEDKRFWVVEHDGLVFGSGWHHDETGN